MVIDNKILSTYNERMSLYDLLVSEWQYPNPNRYVSELTISARTNDRFGAPGGRLMVITRGAGRVMTIDISNSPYRQSVRLPRTPIEDISFRVIGSDVYLEQMIIR
jgi:hypothetical protein